MSSARTPIPPIQGQDMDPLSLTSYIAYTYRDLQDGLRFEQGTVSIAKIDDELYIVTARHVLLNPDSRTGQINEWEPGHPRRIGLKIPVLEAGRILRWDDAFFRLYDNNERRLWREVLHEDSSEPMDVAVLHLDTAYLGGDERHTVTAFPFEKLTNNRLQIRPSDHVSIVGFPWGMSAVGKAGHLAIWKTGFIACDLSVSWEGWPAFIVDATTTSGMSGSPVFAVRRDNFRADPAGGGVQLEPNMSAYQYLGVYSGKIAKKEDGSSINIGLVWRPEVVFKAYQTLSPAETMMPHTSSMETVHVR